MKGFRHFNIAILLPLVLATSPALAQAQLYATTIGTKNEYLCQIDTNKKILLSKLADRGTYEAIDSAAELARISTLLRSYRSQITAAQSLLKKIRSRIQQNSLKKKIVTLTSRVAKLTTFSRGIRSCIAKVSVLSSIEDDPCRVIQTSALSDTPPLAEIALGKTCTTSTSAVVSMDLYAASGESLGACSGSVIGPRSILTAAHCLTDGVNEITTRVGSKKFTSSSLFVHPGYDEESEDLQSHDLGVITFDTDLPLQPLGLAFGINVSRGEHIIIAGFGEDERGNAGTLKSARAKVNAVASTGIEILFSARGSTGNTCMGDSGGPLLVKRNSDWLIAGVTSNGDTEFCGESDVSRFGNIAAASNMAFIEAHLH